MGTPDFAVLPLEALISAGEEIIGVVTQADKPQGRGYRLTPPPVKVCALSHGIPVYQPDTLKGEEFASLLSELNPEMIVVAAYGKILPHGVIAYPEYGCINIHGSLLPEYRGAAPMQRAIIDGKTVTGITVMYMDDGLDTGDMLLKREVPIGPDDDFGVIHDRMAECGAKAIVDAVEAIKNGGLDRIPQSSIDSEPTYAKKIEKSECLLDFSEAPNALHNRIRGLSPVPLALTHTPDGRLLKVLKSATEEDGEPEQPGIVVALDGKITVSCGENGCGRISFLTVLPEGKGKMAAADFIRGRKIAVGDRLS